MSVELHAQMDVFCIDKAALPVGPAPRTTTCTATKSASPAVPKPKPKLGVKAAKEAELSKVAKEKQYQKLRYNRSLAPASVKDMLTKTKKENPTLHKELLRDIVDFNPKSNSWSDFEMKVKNRRTATTGT